MKTVELMGLIGAGSVSQSLVARMPSLHVQLGPVKSQSYATAKRLTRTLCSGYPVTRYAELEMCPMIWVSVPEKDLRRVIADLAEQTPIRQTMVVLCGTERDSRWAEPLRKRGARVATLNCIGSCKHGRFVVEGHPETVRAVRKMRSEDGHKLVQIRPAAKALYQAGVYLITDALRPWVASSMDALRAAGFTRAEALAIVETFGTESLHMYGKAGGKPWKDGRERALYAGLEDRAQALRSSHPSVAQIYSEGLRVTLDYFEKRKPAVAATSSNAAEEGRLTPPTAVNQ
ncbi:MAG: hypothetical protein ABI824_05825 [Acidobacteriota bacterium]